MPVTGDLLKYVCAKHYQNRQRFGKASAKITKCSAIAERPRCRVRYSFRQK